MSNNLRARNPCALCPGGVFWLFTKIKSVTVKMCDKFLQYTPHPSAPSLSLCLSLSLYANPPLTLCSAVDSRQTNAHHFMYINNHLHTDRGQTGKKKTTQEAKSNQNLLSLFFMMWLAWITVPLAPISFPRMRHSGSIVQLTKWPLNHVILLSVYHWQKEANLIAHFSRSPKAKYNGNLMKCMKCPYILFSSH